VNREITADDFVSDFLAARHRWTDATRSASANTPGLFDDEQLRVSLARRIQNWDAGTYKTQYE
jgi:hypothetical protein